MRTNLIRHLEQARRHVCEARARVTHQHAVIGELERDAHDTKLARELLRVFEARLAMHIAEEQRFEAELRMANGRKES
jgi:hypothetical protein